MWVMELHIRSNGTKITPGMREFIDRRMAKLDKLADHVVDAKLELRTEEARNGTEVTIAQLTLHTGRHVLRAEEHDPEAAKAIDAAIDKLVTQVRRYTDKRKSRKKRGVPPHVLSDVPADLGTYGESLVPVDTADAEEATNVVRTKRFEMKPMIVDEAIDQMELVGHDFFLFHNMEENELNVLYRRRDGSYGLLAAAPN
jgi:putative sigma-54 modulation protein